MEPNKIVDAVQSTAEASGKLAELAGKAGAFLAKIVGGPAEQIGEIFTDRIRLFKYMNLCAVADKVEAIHRQRKIEGKTIEIPPRLAIPILESAALEDDDTLQNVWARLIANSTDPQFCEGLHPGYIEIVKQMSPDEAIILGSFTKIKTYPSLFIVHIKQQYEVDDHVWWHNFIDGKASYEAVCEICLHHCKQLKIQQQSNARIYIDNLQRLQLVELGFDFSGKERNTLNWLNRRITSTGETNKKNISIPARDEYLRMTAFGQGFVIACINQALENNTT